ncbi:FMN-dependent NADH-azoreductase [Dawidia soli]|uniref:FMN dependent NADH:quinone oxidoreductase n=1 Tax=Dawidia soli TaxID=2782352 RepID=A0AAP2D8S6_9BACT|nr:NAD(P)H-dependent oxidoreductase [Dawidia soli]MBT1687513.1 NAD(P)H-dependent oxidoreductase [Dawidia soli]
MKTLLRIDASIRRQGSFSRTLGDAFVGEWKHRHPQGEVLTRDIGQEPLPHLSDEVANAFFTGARELQVLALSNLLCDELKQASEILITCPMYNFGIPSTLKAWFDQVVRANETFRRDGYQYEGLLHNKTVYIIMAMGDGRTGLRTTENFEYYLTDTLAFMGIHDVRIVTVGGTATRSFTDGWQATYQQSISQLLNN